MSTPVIAVSGLGKRYVIAHESRHDSLRDTLHHTARRLWRKFRWGTGFETEEFWALQDINFSIQPGEVVGVIGGNGAGKSTLLKVLSRITEPSTGQIRLRGRVASLLEVGTGFHPDLTGRENIFLNGAILGMRRQEVRQKFDEIVAFAEIEKFLDTPVKRYSSGMYVRLAFAVAAHLDPEILIVDEVLAVGDQQFQNKCLGKMQSIANGSGRTVLFVSHNMSAVLNLCGRALLLDHGTLALDGPTQEVVTRYLQHKGSSSGRWINPRPADRAAVAIRAVEIQNEQGQPSATVDNGRPLCLQIEFSCKPGFVGPLIPSVTFYTATGIRVLNHFSQLNQQVFHDLPAEGVFRFCLPKLPLPGGRYYVSAFLVAHGALVDQADNALEVQVVDASFYALDGSTPGVHGLVLAEGDWSLGPTV
ncbi:Teichoic acids export ATP-binding protein TagH [Lacunisphaera limnophila]|uniref:Teichoic acids export ATP-binding protein TagH n=1 Tax=Lacunisphaera limnophila TaxID=1838286 RepID=A0A1D8AXY6_9BACT|nr:ABC transporter ATP-binding protein [Lacunisphaera limnophila]AOS45753.1 Teichoic acids export ATP-binding protein TagH [Lacunisphaera limnophila]